MKTEELLERLVNAVEKQNRLIAMIIANKAGASKFTPQEDVEEKISEMSLIADILLKD